MKKLTGECEISLKCIIKYLVTQETVASGRFMRGTDPIKSTWVYPNLFL